MIYMLHEQSEVSVYNIFFQAFILELTKLKIT